MKGLIFRILQYVSFPMWIHTPCTTHSIISFYCHSQLQHLTSAGVNRNFGVAGEGKNSCHRRNLQAPKGQVTRGAWGHASWKNFEIWAF